ncbi:MAG: hypothetical protein JWN99_933, partial [Ilumatobacteraceae bacterium]|nr:hypothetical protein [Ilumatobacteraceae bacterium]
QEPPPGWGEVWATSDATATSGVWFSITLLNYRSDIAGNATRVDLDGRTGLLEQLDNGWLRLSAPTNDVDVDRSLSIVSFGLAVDQLTALFTSIMVVETDDAGGVRIGLDTTVLDGLAEGLAPLAMGPTQDDLLQRYLAGSAGSLPGHTSTYYSTGGGATYIAIDTAPRDDSLDAMGHIAVGPIRIFPDTASVPSDFTGEGLVLGVSPGGANHEIVARWDAGDTTVVVHTTMPLADLLPLLPQVRHTTAAEWRVVLRRVNSQTATTSDYQAGGGIDLAGGTLADGSSWSSSWHSPSWVQIRAGTGSFIVSVSSADLAADPLQILATGSAISVTALVPSDPVPAVLRILDRHRVLIEVPLIEIATIDPASSVAGRVAAVMVQHLGPYEVEVIDANETVIAHFDSPGSQAQGSA